MTPLPQTPAPVTAADVPPTIAVALGRIPSGLFVVTWRSAEQDRGMLASWVMQAGFEPPMLTVAVARSRELLAALATCAPFVVNVLADDQRSMLARFGKPGDDAFAGLPIDRAPCGAATLPGAAAWLECHPVAQTDGSQQAPGDHAIVLARVIAAGAGVECPPLVHLRKNGLRY